MTGNAVLAPGVLVADTYEVDRLIGRGGMGEVWLARHRRLAGKQVAIKVLHIEGDLTTEALARFRREAEIAARLEHPNLVQVLDFNTLPSGQPYLVMELLKGESLAARVRQGSLDLESVQGLVRQVGAALQAAHTAGVVHRDLKPENIFLVPTALGDSVKVLDFGISKLTESNTVQTTDSVLIGTPLYMSPEQALGNNRDVTAQSDLFSLGSICYELLAGDAPFASANIATVVFRIAYEKHVPLLQRRPDLSPQVAAAVERALEKDRRARTQTIEEFVAEFTGKPINARPGSGVVAVYQPGMAVSDSLLSGKTVAPAPLRPQLATPGEQPPPPPPVSVAPSRAPQPQTGAVSGTRVAVGLLLTVGLLFGLVKVMRPWADAQKAALAALEDAGVPEVDAGAPETADAGEATVRVDAGVPVVVAPPVVSDAGQTTPREVRTLPPGSAADLALLASMQEAANTGQWDSLVNKRSLVRQMEPKTRAYADAVKLLLRAICERREDSILTEYVQALKRTAPRELPEVRRLCIELWPDSKTRDW